jgi:hypothetical protein
MSADDVEIAKRFLDVLWEAARTGDREPVFPLLADDVDWVPRALNGIAELRQRSNWAWPPEKLEIEFEQGELTDLGDGLIVSDVRQQYRMRSTGEFAYARERRVEITIRQGKIARYDMRIVA